MNSVLLALALLFGSATAFAPNAWTSRTAGLQRTRVAARAQMDMKTLLVYSTTTGNTEVCAGYISEATGIPMVDIGDASDEDIAGADCLICGAPTWHTGADEQRSGTEWDSFLYDRLPNLDLSGKKIAIFGLGDQGGYGDNFCDAMGELYDLMTAKGATACGATSTDGYDHTDSKSIRDGSFVGMPFDEDNQSDLSEERATAWLEQLKGEGFAF